MTQRPIAIERGPRVAVPTTCRHRGVATIRRTTPRGRHAVRWCVVSGRPRRTTSVRTRSSRTCRCVRSTARHPGSRHTRTTQPVEPAVWRRAGRRLAVLPVVVRAESDRREPQVRLSQLPSDGFHIPWAESEIRPHAVAHLAGTQPKTPNAESHENSYETLRSCGLACRHPLQRGFASSSRTCGTSR
jgi:hypothetical protein